jgi:hypothetical protein
MVLAALLAAGPASWLSTGYCQPPNEKSIAGEQTYLLSCGGQNASIEISVAARSRIRTSLLVDVVGLRLWVDNAESLGHIRAQIANPAAAYRLVLTSLTEKLRETGIEPNTVPVRGEEGKKSGTDGMVLIEGGEFTRPGEYYDSSGGGLTILPDGTIAVSGRFVSDPQAMERFVKSLRR